MPSLADINAADRDAFVSMLGGVFEHSLWVAGCAQAKRPFASTAEVHDAMMECVRSASLIQQLTLVRAHPELAGREAVEGGLTADSSSEQGRLGFTALSRAEFERMQDINRRYRERFGFPCIVALALHRERSSVISQMESRIGNDQAQELRTALEQIGHITRARLEKLVRG
jgi:2-oxo-4-hydroxy-4-carboxy-5-ureidoimidazoline decarboxylase